MPIYFEIMLVVKDFYQVEAKFIAIYLNNAKWGTCDDLLQLLLSLSKVKNKTSIKERACTNLSGNAGLIIPKVSVTMLCLMCAVTHVKQAV